MGSTNVLARNSPAGSKPRSGGSNRIYATLRTFGLHVLQAWSKGSEPKKLAYQKDRATALIRCAIHVVPLIAALTLLYLNFSWYSTSDYWGVSASFQPASGLVGLQFAAKLHELTMIASLTTTFLTYVRFYLISEDGLPFGVAFSGLQVSARGESVT